MTILVAYVPRPEGQAALDKGIEIARTFNEPLVVVNAGVGGSQEEIQVLAESLQVSMIIIGLRKRSRWANSSWAAWPRNFFSPSFVPSWQSNPLVE